ncbi:MAG: ankyrin repeat domain-containing protein [Hyphomicrobiales bacterium]|nr:ankyrin repeat domain-containing protein [Hyphomicrobiales bacterium]
MNDTDKLKQTGDRDAADLSADQLFEVFRTIDEAFRGEDMEALRIALGNPEEFPNSLLPKELEMGESILHHAIFFSPIGLVRKLVEAGADTNFGGGENVPSLFSAILSERDDRVEIMEVLFEHGARISQMGYNDWTPLHLAVNARDVEAIGFLVGRGADPYWRASDDDADTSAFDDALAMGFDEGVEAMLNGGQSR